MKERILQMIDIETTGVDIKNDDIMEVGIVEIAMSESLGYYEPTGRKFHMRLHTPKKPESQFAKEHMTELYGICNDLDPEFFNLTNMQFALSEYLHGEERTEKIQKGTKKPRPQMFIGWNASTFDLPFMFENKLLQKTWYEQVNGKEELFGDVHYRVYEQSGALQGLIDATGFDRKTVKSLIEEFNPTNIKLPEGKAHDALYDCYKQIIMQNSMIAIHRKGYRKY